MIRQLSIMYCRTCFEEHFEVIQALEIKKNSVRSSFASSSKFFIFYMKCIFHSSFISEWTIATIVESA